MSEYLSFISFIPKAALAALLVVGGFIVYEIASIFKIPSRIRLRRKKDKPKEELKPIKFPKQGVPFEVEKKKDINARRRTILTILAVLTIITGITAGIFVVSQNQNMPKQEDASPSTFSPITKPPADTPVPTVSVPSPPAAVKSPGPPDLENLDSTESARIEKSAQIKIYQIVDGEWVEIQEADLKLLSAGSTIYIAAFSANNYPQAVFRSNGKIIQPAPASQINPLGELYVEYTLPAGEKEFRLEVQFLKS